MENHSKVDAMTEWDIVGLLKIIPIMTHGWKSVPKSSYLEHRYVKVWDHFNKIHLTNLKSNWPEFYSVIHRLSPHFKKAQNHVESFDLATSIVEYKTVVVPNSENVEPGILLSCKYVVNMLAKCQWLSKCHKIPPIWVICCNINSDIWSAKKPTLACLKLHF